MNSSTFNPVSVLISLAVGWFVMAFLHALVASLFSAGTVELIPRFQAIAFFKDRRAAGLDIALIVVIGLVTNVLWFLAHRR